MTNDGRKTAIEKSFLNTGICSSGGCAHHKQGNKKEQMRACVSDISEPRDQGTEASQVSSCLRGIRYSPWQCCALSGIITPLTF